MSQEGPVDGSAWVEETQGTEESTTTQADGRRARTGQEQMAAVQQQGTALLLLLSCVVLQWVIDCVCLSVCLFVYLYACISWKLRDRTSPNFCVCCQWPWLPLPSVLWRCCLGGTKGIRPVKTECWDSRMVICLGEMQICIWPSWCHCHPLSFATLIQIGFTFLVLPLLYLLTRVVPDKV